jgi:hypothetical protein
MEEGGVVVYAPAVEVHLERCKDNACTGCHPCGARTQVALATFAVTGAALAVAMASVAPTLITFLCALVGSFAAGTIYYNIIDPWIDGYLEYRMRNRDRRRKRWAHRG